MPRQSPPKLNLQCASRRRSRRAQQKKVRLKQFRQTENLLQFIYYKVHYIPHSYIWINKKEIVRLNRFYNFCVRWRNDEELCIGARVWSIKMTRTEQQKKKKNNKHNIIHKRKKKQTFPCILVIFASTPPYNTAACDYNCYVMIIIICLWQVFFCVLFFVCAGDRQ